MVPVCIMPWMEIEVITDNIKDTIAKIKEF
jgi:hypothetical protein